MKIRSRGILATIKSQKGIYSTFSIEFQRQVSHARKKVRAFLRTHKTPQLWKEKRKLYNIGKKQILKIRQIKQIQETLEEKALTQKTNYNWEGLDFSLDPLSKCPKEEVQ